MIDITEEEFKKELREIEMQKQRSQANGSATPQALNFYQTAKVLQSVNRFKKGDKSTKKSIFSI